MQTPNKIYKIRKLNSSHIEAVHNLEALCFDCPWSKEQFQEALNSPVYLLLGAFCKDTLLSYLLITQIEGYVEILNIASHPQHRRKGLAKQLLQAFFEPTYCSDRNLAQKQTENPPPLETILEVRAQNIAAQELYKQFNFQAIHTRKNYYKDDDAIVMQRIKK